MNEQRPVAAGDLAAMTKDQLQAEIGRLQAALVRRVCGDPIQGIGLRTQPAVPPTAGRAGDGASTLKESSVGPSAEAEALRNLADHARIEVEVMRAGDGSMSAQRAACLEWLACGAEYQHMLRGGPTVSTGKLLAAEQNLVKQIRFLMA